MTTTHAADIAARLDNARANFIETLQHFGKCDAAAAERVFEYYRKNKLIKLQLGIGRYSAKHGAYLDYDIIRRAIELTR